MLLRRATGAAPVTVDEARLWPIFVLVVEGRRDMLAASARPLCELLEAYKTTGELTIMSGRTQWTAVDPRHALLRLTVRVAAPARFEAEILVPAERVLNVLDVVARGATIGITSRRHAAVLRGRVDPRTALRHLVLVSCPPSTELGELTTELCGANL